MRGSVEGLLFLFWLRSAIVKLSHRSLAMVLLLFPRIRFVSRFECVRNKRSKTVDSHFAFCWRTAINCKSIYLWTKNVDSKHLSPHEFCIFEKAVRKYPKVFPTTIFCLFVTSYYKETVHLVLSNVSVYNVFFISLPDGFSGKREMFLF